MLQSMTQPLGPVMINETTLAQCALVNPTRWLWAVTRCSSGWGLQESEFELERTFCNSQVQILSSRRRLVAISHQNSQRHESKIVGSFDSGYDSSARRMLFSLPEKKTMKQTSRLVFSLILLSGLTGSIFAQKPEFETSYNEKFLRRSPLIGTTPEVELFDALGKPFKITSVKDRYTVVVFGCLT